MTTNKVDGSETLGKVIEGSHSAMLIQALARALASIMDSEAGALCGADFGVRSEERSNTRNGYRERPLETRMGTVDLRIPKLREGSYLPSFLEPRRRWEQAFVSVVSEAYVRGVSTRKVDELVKAMGAKGMSKSEVSRLCATLDEDVLAFRRRKLDRLYPYLWLDALYLKVRDGRMDSAEDAIGIAGLDGIVRETNRGWEALLGRTRDEIIGSPVHDFIAPESRAIELEHLAKLPEQQRYRRNVQFVRPDGTRVEAELVNSIAEIGGELVCVVVARDATERNLLEAQLRQAQKIEAVGQLAGGVAHDFNNILAVILANCDFLLEDLPEGDKGRTDVEQILTAGQRAVALTRQLTAFSRKQVLEPRVVSLNAAVSEVWKMLRRIIGEDIELVTALDEHVANAFIDVAQLEQVLLNLAVNARDAMPDGGALTLRTCNAEMGDDFVATHPGARLGRYVVLSVTDTGTGMSTDVQSHMFEPFFTTKEKGKGTGLGLATVYGIVKQSGGYILVESRPGRGSVFTIYLPRVDAPAEAFAISTGSKNEMAHGETILILEDELMVQQAVARVLRERGYRTLVASTPEEAVTLSREHPGTIDLLLSDVVLPGMSGPAVAASLLVERPRMTALFMSGFSDHVSTPDGVESPAFHFIQKPFTPTAIAAKLRALLGNQNSGD